MSSISSALTSLASVSTMDFVKSLAKGRSEDWYFRFSRKSTVIWAIALCVVAYASRAQDSVLNLSFALRGMTSGALLGSLILVIWWRRGSALPVVLGMAVSIIVMAAINFFFEWEVPGPNGAITKAKIAWPWYTLIGTAITLTVASLFRRFIPNPQRTDPLTG